MSLSAAIFYFNRISVLVQSCHQLRFLSAGARRIKLQTLANEEQYQRKEKVLRNYRNSQGVSSL